MKEPLVVLCLVLSSAAGVAMAGSTDAPSAQTAAVAEVLALQKRMSDAALTGDVSVFSERLSRDFVASDPSNTIRRRDDLIELFSKRQVVYQSVETTVDFAGQLGANLVVVMGTESTTQSSVPADTGLADVATAHTLHRRYTNVYRREDGVWRLLIKQSTIFALK